MPRVNNPKIECLDCGHPNSRIVYTKAIVVSDSKDNKRHVVRRRRKCLKCGKRFTTIESHERDVLEPLKGQKTWD